MSNSKPKEKQLCDWSKKEIRERFDELCVIVTDAQYLCAKCGRAANQEHWLCKPKRV